MVLARLQDSASSPIYTQGIFNLSCVNMYSMLRDSSLTYDASSRNLLPTFFTVAYRCGEARQLFRQDKEGETLFYDEFEITCLRNGTYNKNSSVVR